MIEYTEEKKFTQDEVQELFLSVNWVSGEYPKRLYKALMHSSTVISAWVDGKLCGLVRVLDDSEMLAYVHYVLVNPKYQGLGIAGHLIELVKEKYKDYLYIEGMPEDKSNVAFYVKHGFKSLRMLVVSLFVIRVKKNSLNLHIYKKVWGFFFSG